MRNQFKLLAEKYRNVQENNKDDIMAGLEELSSADPLKIAVKLGTSANYEEFEDTVLKDYNYIDSIFLDRSEAEAADFDYVEDPAALNRDYPDPIADILAARFGDKMVGAYIYAYWALRIEKQGMLNPPISLRDIARTYFQNSIMQRNLKETNDKEDIMRGLDALSNPEAIETVYVATILPPNNRVVYVMVSVSLFKTDYFNSRMIEQYRAYRPVGTPEPPSYKEVLQRMASGESIVMYPGLDTKFVFAPSGAAVLEKVSEILQAPDEDL